MNAVVAGVCFFKGYCDVAKLKIIQKLFSQIWLRTWNESKNCFKKISCSILGYIFGTYHKTLGIWNFFFCSLKSGEFGPCFFSLKNPSFV
jgi:hypothetical protein